jgi:aminopeptidase
VTDRITKPESLLPAAELARYADAVVRGCLDVREGELLLVRCLPSAREAAVALAEAGYRAGARLVDVIYADTLVQAARIRHARDEDLGPLPPWERARMRAAVDPDTAIAYVFPSAEAGAFDGLPPERVAADYAGTARRLGRIRRAYESGRRRWCALAWPTEEWALQVYPELDRLAAQQRLARDLLEFCRLGPGDPPGHRGWTDHAARLAERARALTALGLERVEIRDRGTSLDVRLAPDTRWLGGPRENAYGRIASSNFPTEESFTSPDPRSTEGTFRCSRPLFFRGRTIAGIAGEFRRGRLVRLEAASEDDRDFLAAALDRDRGARRLGEVALVDSSSRIGRARRTYFDTLLDENAAAHIAFGTGFDATRPREPGTRARGVNRSLIHLDVMIGTDELEATGIAAGGRRVALVRDGAWQVP